jgi:lysophospholipase L1-like esterase
VIATLTPMLYEHEAYHVMAADMSAMIRQLASEEGVAVADLEAAFNDQSKYMSADGLHPNEAGNQLVAATFFDVLN